MAEKKKVTAAQISLAWVLANDPTILPIPGTRKVKYLTENVGSAEVKLSDDEFKQLNDYVIEFSPVGGRYDSNMASGAAF